MLAERAWSASGPGYGGGGWGVGCDPFHSSVGIACWGIRRDLLQGGSVEGGGVQVPSGGGRVSSEEVRKGRPDVEEKQASTTDLVPSHSRPARGLTLPRPQPQCERRAGMVA